MPKDDVETLPCLLSFYLTHWGSISQLNLEFTNLSSPACSGCSLWFLSTGMIEHHTYKVFACVLESQIVVSMLVASSFSGDPNCGQHTCDKLLFQWDITWSRCSTLTQGGLDESTSEQGSWDLCLWHQQGTLHISCEGKVGTLVRRDYVGSN